MARSILQFYLFILLSAFCHRVSGQSYSIDWHTIAGGGGTSSNGQYAVSGTIGQPGAGEVMTGSSYALMGGFWAVLSLVQTSGAPTLYISHSGNTVMVYWMNTSDWMLQQNNNPADSAGWAASSGITSDNGTNSMNLTAPTGNLFFRLKSGETRY